MPWTQRGDEKFDQRALVRGAEALGHRFQGAGAGHFEQALGLARGVQQALRMRMRPAHQAVTDRQLRIQLHDRQRFPTVLEHADVEPAQHVDDGDDDARDCIAADEFAGTVPRTVEVGFLRDRLAATPGLGFVDHAGVQVGIDRHLLAGHGIQGEPGRHFADSAAALGDHDELDHEDDHEDDDADGERPRRHEAAERVDDLAGAVNGLSWVRVAVAGG